MFITQEQFQKWLAAYQPVRPKQNDQPQQPAQGK